MAYAFGTPAKPTFGNLRESLYQSEYINKKKGKITYCENRRPCARLQNADSYDEINVFNSGLYAYRLRSCPIIPCSKDNLVVGQYTKMNLKDVCVVIEAPPCSNPDTLCPACEDKDTFRIDLSSTAPFYQNNTIDPQGELFGRTECGENNFSKYMVYNGKNLAFA
jgi:hypothetical protein